MSDLITEHVGKPTCSRLRQFLPKLTRLFLPLDLTRALLEYDATTHFLARKRVPPTFKVIRHILNVVTTNAIAGKLKLLTLGADDTIYEDGESINKSSKIVQIDVELIRRGIVVSLLTAACYPGNPSRYEQSLCVILEALADLTIKELPRFLVMGGECNYRFETYTDTISGIVGLREIDGAIWKAGQRAIGIINTSNKRFFYENLEEISITLQHQLRHFHVPFYAFNGGNDVWINIKHKALGIQDLQKYVFRFLPLELRGSEEMRNIQVHECLLVGDRFTITGNKTLSRDVAATIWVSNPQETGCVMSILLQAIDLEHQQKREQNAEKEQERENKDWKAEANATDTTQISDDESDNSFDTWAGAY
ncbi:hypothetical protein PsorP6_010899 [Peronosclerospora sorghi]|uniref:Uncharacterized protein n=1 Tax=Peronosclerospora sorghi TaxID=230839 RepID=A0ACC0VWV3_9STRA|nr:hypothetical protein PsorP6_010899 [Peronosclerospora sorghi]